MKKNATSSMHTAEHILNGVMVETFGCDRCFSAHINPKKSKCDYHLERDLTKEEAKEVEARVNEQISRNLPVQEEKMSLAEARKRFNLKRLPEGVKSVRIIHIGDYDACPCIGQHVARTNEIGHFTLTTHSWSDGVLRIRFKLADEN